MLALRQGAANDWPWLTRELESVRCTRLRTPSAGSAVARGEAPHSPDPRFVSEIL